MKPAAEVLQKAGAAEGSEIWPATTFVQALESLFEETVHDAARRAGVTVVLQELYDLAEHCPDQLLLILAAGYVQFAQQRRTGSERELAFVNVSYAVDELCAVYLEPPPVDRPAANTPKLYQRNLRQLFDLVTGRP